MMEKLNFHMGLVSRDVGYLGAWVGVCVGRFRAASAQQVRIPGGVTQPFVLHWSPAALPRLKSR